MVESHEVLHVLPEPRAIASPELRVLLEAALPTVRGWLRGTGTGDHEHVSWVDDPTDLGLDMPAHVAVASLPELMSLPERTYLLSRVDTGASTT